MKMQTNVKNGCLTAIAKYKDQPEEHRTYLAWLNQPVECYGEIIAPYGKTYPYNVPHISVRLATPGSAAFSVAALDELVDPLPDNLPKQPTYSGLAGLVYSLDNG
jgi:hypothetical protein